MLVTLDFETYYTSDYSLRKMMTQEYILDPRFEVTLLSLKIDKTPAIVIPPHGVDLVLHSIPWDKATLLCHNTAFDAAILAWHYGLKPAFYLDTMSMAHAWYSHRGMSSALAALAHLVGMSKDTDALANMAGAKASHYNPAEERWQRFIEYARHDVETCFALMKHMLDTDFPQRELQVIDIVIRMFVERRLVIDQKFLAEHLKRVQIEKQDKCRAADIPEGQLRSRTGFAKLLREAGVEPPMKVSDRTGERTMAFAKSDAEFMALLQHPSQRVRDLVEARLAVSTSIEETRSQRLITLCKATPDNTLAVPLKYSGAHSHRFSGTDNLNLQNLGARSGIRKAIKAPPGHVLVVVDASQIEARICAWIAGEFSINEQFGNGEDVYSSFASKVYGFEVVKESHPVERKVGKTGILGLQFGCGGPKFHWMLQQADIDADLAMAHEIVNVYRKAYPRIPALWRQGDQVLRAIIDGRSMEFGPCHTVDEGLSLPSGLVLDYPGLSDQTGQFTYTHPRYGANHPIWGGVVTENVVQALDHDVISTTMIDTRREHPEWHCALQVHDEVIYCVKERDGQACHDWLVWSLSQTPRWADSRLMLGAEGVIVERYGDAKG